MQPINLFFYRYTGYNKVIKRNVCLALIPLSFLAE